MAARPKDIAKLIDVGATEAQARAALEATDNDVGDAAQAFLSGVFDDVASTSAAPCKPSKNGTGRTQSSQDNEDFWEDEAMDYDDGGFMADSFMAEPSSKGANGSREVDTDAYRDLDLSLDRTETVIEVLDKVELYDVIAKTSPDARADIVSCKVMTSGEWMKGINFGSEQSSVSISDGSDDNDPLLSHLTSASLCTALWRLSEPPRPHHLSQYRLQEATQAQRWRLPHHLSTALRLPRVHRF